MRYTGGSFLVMVLVVLFLGTTAYCVDSVVVFNEIMYHSAENENDVEWIEFHNQLVVDVDMSGWRVSGGVDYEFPSGSVIEAEGFVVVALVPDVLTAKGLTGVLGPFTGRLSNSGEVLRLRNNSNRVMDEVDYGDGGDWPVGPDGSGVSLAKIAPGSATDFGANWKGSLQIGGTPGRENFPSEDFVADRHDLIGSFDSWRYNDKGVDLGSQWRSVGYVEDGNWGEGAAGLYVGSSSTGGERVDIETLFSSGLDDEGNVLGAGQEEPHYTIISTGEPVLAMQNHSAWLGNSAYSQWIGLSGQGTDNLPAGEFVFGTSFDLAGYDSSTAEISFKVAVDNTLVDIIFNGSSLGISYEGFSSLSPTFTIDSGFVDGINTIEFVCDNAGSAPNPAGLRVEMGGTAVGVLEQTELAAGARTYYFRKQFEYVPDFASYITLQLDSIVDDGAIVYLNGMEVYRWNMPGGIVGYNTYALSEVVEPEFTGSVTIPKGSLVSGTNVLAVEVHQAFGSSDMLFATNLAAIETPVPPMQPPSIAINEIGSAQTAPIRIELFNYGEMRINLAGFKLVCAGNTTGEYVFASGWIEAGGYVVVDEGQLGFHPSDEDNLFLYNSDGSIVVDAAVVKNSHRGRIGDGIGRWAYPDVETPGSENSFAFHDEIVINEIMYHYRPIPETQAHVEDTTLLTSGAIAAVHVPADDSLGLAWTGADESFDDSSWTDGVGNTTGIGYETTVADYAGLIGTDVLSEMHNGNTSVYIRVPFEISNPDDIETLILSMKYDDGFVAYLNGVEVKSKNAPGRDGDTKILTWNSSSTASHPDSEAVVFTEDDITPYKQHLRAGTNILAIHGLNWSAGSTDMLIVPRLQARKALVPYVPFHESDQEWIELYNRSNQAVSLQGWKIRGGIDYDFDAMVTILPGEYLVVARDSEQLRAEYPDVDILGDFSGRLSDKGDDIVLTDDNKNIADEIRYYDRGYWSEFADGGGMSLELVDPDADNSNPLVWQASDETQRCSWKTYSYRAVANPSQGSNEPTIWNELFLGLLDSGEVLLDDISVIEDPDGARSQLIQAGSFESGGATWRLLGNQGLGAIITDPDNAYNHVLHLVATGATEHMHNHVETTYVSGQSVNNGVTYEISYRAKWLAGSNQLNTRLYFNRAGKTIMLETPTISGTPGERNSRYITNMGPTISELQHSPAVPSAGGDITITAQGDDPDGIDSMTLMFSVNGGVFEAKTMTLNISGLYEAVIDGMPSATIVQFYVHGRDLGGAETQWPVGGSESRALFKVDDGQAYPEPRHNFRIIMTADDADFLHQSTNVMSNHRMPATVIFNESEVYYDVGVHIKGSGYGRNNNRAGFNVRFRPDQLFNGVHDVVATDRSGGPGGIGASHRELVVKHIGNHAGGIPCMYDDIVNTISPRGDLNGLSQLLLARYDDAFLESQYDNGTEGTLFEFELIYYSQNTVDGNPQSLKQPPSSVRAIDFRNMGDDKEAYRWNYQMKNNRAADDFSRVIDMAKAFGMSSAQIESEMDKYIDVDQWMRVFAFESLGGIGDTYNQGLAHNLMIYVRPADQRVLAMPWDMDFAFFQSTSASIFGSGSNLQKVIAIDRFKRLFYGHIHDIINTTFKNEYLADWIDHYGSTCGQNVSSEIFSRVDQRRNFVLERLPGQVSFVITSNGGNPITVDADSVTLQGDGWINVRNIRLAGSEEPLEVSWADLDSWEASVPLAFGQNTLVLQAYDYQDNLISSDMIAVTSISSERPLRNHLRVTELMYDSAGGKDYEFIEFCNTGPDPLDITHVTISGGIEFAFAGNAVTTLQPGQYVVVVEDIAEFEARYGDGVAIAGQYTGSLGNGGEPIVVRARYNAEILAFDYNDSRSWPLAADGTGHSLVPVDGAIVDESVGSLNYGGNWRASSFIFGSPGAADPVVADEVVLNEIMAHTDYFVLPHESNDWVELFNRGDASVGLNADWCLSDDKNDLAKWSLPDMMLPVAGRVSFDEVNDFHNPIDTGFGLNKAGEALYLSYLPANGQKRVVDCIRFKGQENGVSLGRISDGQEYWRHMIPTRGQSNGTVISDIIISEIMYWPVESNYKYIELYNPTATEVTLSNVDGPWRIDGTVEYDFALDASIPAGGRLLVVGFDPVIEANLTEAFIAYYDSKPLTAGVDIVGPFIGDLSDVTGRVAVERPQEPDTLGDSVSWVIGDEAIYFHQSPFPEITGETSLVVLQRIDFTTSGNNPAAWEAAVPTPGTKRIVPADLNKDGKVDLADYGIFLAAWLSESGDTEFCEDCDIAKPSNGTIDLADLAKFIMQWMR